jgi:DNA-binding transcriptional ArsR family regulator
MAIAKVKLAGSEATKVKVPRQSGKARRTSASAKTGNPIERLTSILGNPTRLRVVVMLEHAEDLSVTDLARRLKVKPSSLGRDVDLLRQSELVGPRLEGRADRPALTAKGRRLARLIGGLVPAESPTRPKVPAKLMQTIRRVVADPDAWLNRPNPEFEGRRPIDLVGTKDEVILRIVVEAAEQGFFA